eukprot:UC1_evm1s1732
MLARGRPKAIRPVPIQEEYRVHLHRDGGRKMTRGAQMLAAALALRKKEEDADESLVVAAENTSNSSSISSCSGTGLRLDSLPPDVIEHLGQMLSFRDLIALRSVCRTLYHATNSTNLWSMLLVRDFCQSVPLGPSGSNSGNGIYGGGELGLKSTPLMGCCAPMQLYAQTFAVTPHCDRMKFVSCETCGARTCPMHMGNHRAPSASHQNVQCSHCHLLICKGVVAHHCKRTGKPLCSRDGFSCSDCNYSACLFSTFVYHAMQPFAIIACQMAKQLALLLRYVFRTIEVVYSAAIVTDAHCIS